MNEKTVRIQISACFIKIFELRFGIIEFVKLQIASYLYLGFYGILLIAHQRGVAVAVKL